MKKRKFIEYSYLEHFFIFHLYANTSLNPLETITDFYAVKFLTNILNIVKIGVVNSS